MNIRALLIAYHLRMRENCKMRIILDLISYSSVKKVIIVYLIY